MGLIAIYAAAALLVFKAGVTVIRGVASPYLTLQLCVTVALVLSGLGSGPVASLFIPFLYFSVFVVEYICLLHLFRSGFLPRFVVIVSVAASAAAAISLYEWFAGQFLPPYDYFYALLNEVNSADALTQTHRRVWGTLGNPILMGVGLAWALPFVVEWRSPWLRTAAVVATVAASALTFSRSTLVALAVVAVGALVLRSPHGGRRWRRLVIVSAVLATVVLMGVYVLAVDLDDLADRLRLRKGDANALTRLELLEVTYRLVDQRDIPVLLFGTGPRSTVTVLEMEGWGSETLTVDNTYATLLIEIGLVGCVSYLLMLFAVLRRHRHEATLGLHWFSIASVLFLNVAFVTAYYATINLLWVASVAALEDRRRRSAADRSGR